MNKFARTASGCFILLLCAGLILYPKQAAQGVSEGLGICAATIIPTLFPFMVLAQLAVRSGFAERLGRAAAPVFERIFFLPGVCAPVVLMGMTGGYPVGARMAAGLYRAGSIGPEHLNRLLCFCVNAGPSFIISTVGVMLLGSERAGLIMLAAAVASSLTVGIVLGVLSKLRYTRNSRSITRPSRHRGEETRSHCTSRRSSPEADLRRSSGLFHSGESESIGGPCNKSAENPAIGRCGVLTGSRRSGGMSSALIFSVREAGQATLSMCCYILLICSFISVMEGCGLMELLSDGLSPVFSRFGLPPSLAGPFLSCLLEVGSGCVDAQDSAILICWAIGWAGLSVHLQIFSFLGEIKFNRVMFVLSRLVCAALNCVYFRLMLRFFPVDIEVFSSVRRSVSMTLPQLVISLCFILITLAASNTKTAGFFRRK